MSQAREHPDKSLGVGAFSVAQRDAIVDELELLRRAESSLEHFFVTAKPEPFFVKNLENIQGDERDVIFISVGYGKNESGYMAMNFGPLSNDGGERRLNVLISRARECCSVFSSIRASPHSRCFWVDLSTPPIPMLPLPLRRSTTRSLGRCPTVSRPTLPQRNSAIASAFPSLGSAHQLPPHQPSSPIAGSLSGRHSGPAPGAADTRNVNGKRLRRAGAISLAAVCRSIIPHQRQPGDP